MKGKQNSHDNIHEHSKLSKIPNERSKEEEKRGKENILLTQTLVLMVQHKKTHKHCNLLDIESTTKKTNLVN